MAKNLKKTFILLLSLMTLLAVTFAAAIAFPQKASASAFTGDRYFEIVGASVRTVDESSGLRFTANFNKAVYDEVFDENGAIEGKKLGIIVVPEAYATAAEGAESYGAAKYYEYFRDVKGKYKNFIFDTESVSVNESGVYVANAALVNILLENMDLNFVAIGYIATTTEAESGTVTTYEYTEKSEAKNVADLVALTLNDGDVDYNADPENLAVLQEIEAKAIYDKAGVTFDDLTQKYVYEGTSYDNYSDIILDKGDLGEIELASGSKSYATAATFGINAKYDRAVSVKLGTADVSATATDGNVNLSGLKIGELNEDTGSYAYTPFGNQKLTFDFGNVKFSANVLSVSDIITTKVELLEFIDAANRVELIGAVSSYNGYYKLGADIDMGGDAVSNTLPLTGVNAYYNSPYAGFLGTFDGAGYAIYNFTVNTHKGLFTGINQGGVLKNVSLLGVKIKTVGGASGGTLGQSVYNATIENVRISVEAVSGKYTGAIARRVRGNDTKLNNVIIDYASSLTADEDATSSIFFEVNEKPVATNVLVIKDADKPLNSAYPTQVVSGIASTTWDAPDYSTVVASVFDTDTYALPVLKGDSLVIPYTADYYKGRSAQSWWENQESAVLFGKIGETVTASKALKYADTTPIADISTASAVLAKDVKTELKYYYESTYDLVNVLDSDGNDTGIIFNHYDMTGTQSTNGMEYNETVSGQEDAYYVSHSLTQDGEWYGRIQLLDPSAAYSGNNGTGNSVSGIIKNGGYKTLKFKLLMTHEKAAGNRVQLVGNFADGGSITASICGGNYSTAIDSDFMCIMYNGERIKGNVASENVLNKWLDVYVDVSALAATNNALYITSTVNYYIAGVTLTKDEHPNNYDSISVLNDQGAHTGVYFQFRDALSSAGYYSEKHDMDYVGAYNGVDNAYKLVATYDKDRWARRFAFNKGDYGATGGNEAAMTMRNNYNTLSFKVYLDASTTNLEFQCGGNNINLKGTISDYSCVKVVDKDGAAVTGTLSNGEWYTVTIDLTAATLATKDNHNVYYMYVGGMVYIANMTLSTVAFA